MPQETLGSGMELRAVCGKVAMSTVLEPVAQAQLAHRTGNQCLMVLTSSIRGKVFRISYNDAAGRTHDQH